MVNKIPLAVMLRDGLPDEASRRGFNTAFGAAGGDSFPGPGKDRIRDSLASDERDGYSTAESFFLERNSNLEFATKGAAIALADPRVAAGRIGESDAFFSLGFDIATGLFGDPALGGRGDTQMGPGKQKIRDALSVPGQRGFAASMALHLGPPPLARRA